MEISILKSRVSSRLQEAHFYSSEDSQLFFEGIATAIQDSVNNDNSLCLVDFCTGSGIIPLHFYLQGSIHSCILSDIYIQKALDNYKAKANDNFEQDIAILRINLLSDEREKVLDFLKENPVMVTANPPYIPLPSQLSQWWSKPAIQNYYEQLYDAPKLTLVTNPKKSIPPLVKQYLDYCNTHHLKHYSLPLIHGGLDGLLFVRPLLSITRQIKAQSLVMNISSLADMSKLMALLQEYEFAIEYMHVLENYAYDNDSSPIVGNHIQHFVSNNFCVRDTNNALRYILFTLVLRPSTVQDEYIQGHEELLQVLRKYKSSKDILDSLRGSSLRWKLWKLSESRESVIRKRIWSDER